MPSGMTPCLPCGSEEAEKLLPGAQELPALLSPVGQGWWEVDRRLTLSLLAGSLHPEGPLGAPLMVPKESQHSKSESYSETGAEILRDRQGSKVTDRPTGHRQAQSQVWKSGSFSLLPHFFSNPLEGLVGEEQPQVVWETGQKKGAGVVLLGVP